MMFTPQRIVTYEEKPRTPEQDAFFKLKARQQELSNQLENVTDRREELAREIETRTGADREGMENRLRALDTQIQQIEIDLASVSKDVAAAAPSTEAEPHVRTIYQGYNDGDLIGAGIGGFFIALTLCIPLFVRLFRRRRYVPPGAATSPGVAGERIDRMEQAIDSIAVEIERVSENQRFMTRLMTETQLAGTIAAVRGSAEAARAAAEGSANV